MANENVNTVIDYFEIPEEIAKELSDLLTKQAIKERLLLQLITESDKFKAVEDMLIPITAKIDAIKAKITKEFVPAQYSSADYMWNYDGYLVDGNKVQIIKIV